MFTSKLPVKKQHRSAMYSVFTNREALLQNPLLKGHGNEADFLFFFAEIGSS
jgi:hypothetical protein